ncbi:hypothetical protein LP419_02275 [Massilia sp. H-1]|nr:hypothetical protein LP419_02275 [Massilia sp. H-1]
MLTSISDELLMTQYRDGDLHAFEELYRRHRVGLYRFIAWRSPRADWVDEIVQDSWANLHHAPALPARRFLPHLSVPDRTQPPARPAAPAAAVAGGRDGHRHGWNGRI